MPYGLWAWTSPAISKVIVQLCNRLRRKVLTSSLRRSLDLHVNYSRQTLKHTFKSMQYASNKAGGDILLPVMTEPHTEGHGTTHKHRRRPTNKS